MRAIPIVLMLALLACCSSCGRTPAEQQTFTKEQAQQLSRRGDVSADSWLVTYYFECVSCSLTEKRMWLEIIAKHRNEAAMVNLADVLARQGGEENCALAERWLMTAAEQGTIETKSSASGWLTRLRAGDMDACGARA